MTKKTLKLYVYCQYRIFCGRGNDRDRQTVKEIEEFVHNVPDVVTRQILIERYIHGGTWKQVACAIGTTEESCRKTAHRYLAMLESSE